MLLDILRNESREAASRPALHSSETQYSLAELLVAVESLADLLRAMGLRRVALYADNGPAWVMADLACQAAGMVVLPLPLFFSRGQIDHALHEAAIELVMVCASAPRPEFLCDAGCVAHSGSGLVLYRLPVEAGRLPLLPGGTSKITFTSGSTGRPKGVCLSSEQQFNVARALLDITGRRPLRHLCLLPLSTLLENIAGVYVPLMGGGSILLPPLSEVGLCGSSGLSLPTLLGAIERLQPESLILLPQLLAALVTAVENGWRPPDSLQFLAVGGGSIAAALITRATDLGLPVHQGYGLSECASVVCLNMNSRVAPGSVGTPLKHLTVRLDNGEIVVGGDVFLGYVNQPQSWGQAEFRTGDLGRVDSEGRVYIDGRIKNIQVSGFGRNLSPEWVESELLAQTGLLQAVVYTEAKPWCVALLTPALESMADAEIQSLVDASNAGLPDYARVMKWQRLPEKLTAASGLLTENGRLRRATIYQHYASALEQMYEQLEENPRHVVFQ